MAYGSPEGVAALASVWTNNGEWLDDDPPYVEGTRPSLSQVETWLEELSDMMDGAMANENFVTPVTVESVVSEFAGVINPLVADLCHFHRAAGRFYTDKFIDKGLNPMTAISREIDTWVTSRVNSFKNRGVPTNAQGKAKSMASINMV